MVKQTDPKHVFWQALVFTIFIFGIGLMSGLFIEGSRLSDVEISAINSEIDLLDAKLRNEVMNSFDIECDVTLSSTFDFADKIYDDAIKLERFDEESSLINTFRSIHRRYDLLRTILWVEIIELKKQCDSDIHTVVYLYEYETESAETEARQNLYSAVTEDLKSKYDNEILLIPIAVNLDVSALDMILTKYALTEFPAIIVDETHTLDGLITIEDLEELI